MGLKCTANGNCNCNERNDRNIFCFFVYKQALKIGYEPEIGTASITYKHARVLCSFERNNNESHWICVTWKWNGEIIKTDAVCTFEYFD